MPYKTSGKSVYVKKAGKWRKKATAKSKGSAKRMTKLLRGIKQGMKPKKRKSK
jgi:hypothetical protein